MGCLSFSFSATNAFQLVCKAASVNILFFLVVSFSILTLSCFACKAILASWVVVLIVGVLSALSGLTTVFEVVAGV
jgi:hypothetical protein